MAKLNLTIMVALIAVIAAAYLATTNSEFTSTGIIYGFMFAIIFLLYTSRGFKL